jgi:hypothetical protein
LTESRSPGDLPFARVKQSRDIGAVFARQQSRPGAFDQRDLRLDDPC